MIPGYRPRRDYYPSGCYDSAPPRCADEECVTFPDVIWSYLEILLSPQMNEAVRVCGGIAGIEALIAVVHVIKTHTRKSESPRLCSADRERIADMFAQAELALLPPLETDEE